VVTSCFFVKLTNAPANVCSDYKKILELDPGQTRAMQAAMVRFVVVVVVLLFCWFLVLFGCGQRWSQCGNVSEFELVGVV